MEVFLGAPRRSTEKLPRGLIWGLTAAQFSSVCIKATGVILGEGGGGSNEDKA